MNIIPAIDLQDGKCVRLLRGDFEQATEYSSDPAEIARQFGDQFAERVEKFEPGRWNGPVNSGFGVHAVKITAKIPGKPAALNDIRQRVVNDWRADRQATESETALARYRSQYEVTVAGRP